MLEDADEAEFRRALEQELGVKLSLDGENVSLSALDIFSKTVGLEQAIVSLAESILTKQKQLKASEIN